MRQIYEVREMLQRQAALMIPLPVERGADRGDWRRSTASTAAMSTMAIWGIHEANDRFHLTMFSACGNAYLVSSIEHLYAAQPAGAGQFAGRQGEAATSRASTTR